MLKNKSINTIKKFSFIFTFSLIITFLLIKASSKIEYDFLNKIKIQTPRKLEVTNEKIEQLCKDGTQEVYDFFYNNTSNDIEEEKYNDNADYIQSLINLIDGNEEKSQAIKDYIKHIIPFLFFFAVGVLSIIGWVICIFCCLCKCCCCCCCKNKCCKGISFILSLGLYGVTVICAIYGLSMAKTLFKGFNATSCSLMRFVYDVIDGQSVEKTPKWIGVSGVQGILQNTIDEIDNNLQESATNFQMNANNLETSFESWKTSSLPNAYNNVKDLHISWQGIGDEYPPLSSSEYKLVPSYVTTYGPYTDSTTTLNAVHSEFTVIKDVIDDANSNIQDTIANEDFTSILSDSSEQIQDLQDQFDKISNDIIDPWYNYQEKVNTIGNKAFYAVFALMTVLVSGLGALVFLFTLNKCKMLGCLLKLLIHVLWNISAILMILSFILGSIFGIIGVVGKDLVSVMHFIMSKDNLQSSEPKVLKSGNAKKYIDICINGDGNLIDELIGDTGNKLDDLLQIREDVAYYQNQLEQHEKSQVIALFENNFENWKNEYLSVPFQVNNGGILNIETIFSEVNSYLKSDNQVSDSSCVKIDDVWGTIDNSNGYTKASPSDTAPAASSKHSINIYDSWSVAYFTNRYSNVCPTPQGSAKDEAPKYYNSFIEIKNGVSTIINQIKSSDDTLNTAYKDINHEMRDILEEINNVIDPLYNIFSELLGPTGGLKTMLNCTFINDDLKIVLKQLYNGLGKNFYNIGTIMVLSSTCIALGICFTLLTINAVKPEDSESSSNNRSNRNRQSMEMNNREDLDSKRKFVVH